MANELAELKSTQDDLEAPSTSDSLTPITQSTPECLHNFQGDEHEQWKLSCFATGNSCNPGQDIVDQVFGLKYWYVHLVTLKNNQDEHVTQPRTVLIDGANNAYGFVSQGVYKSLRNMVAHLGNKPFDPPIPIVVRNQSQNGGRKFFSIEPANEKYVEEEWSGSVELWRAGPATVTSGRAFFILW